MGPNWWVWFKIVDTFRENYLNPTLKNPVYFKDSENVCSTVCTIIQQEITKSGNTLYYFWIYEN